MTKAGIILRPVGRLRWQAEAHYGIRWHYGNPRFSRKGAIRSVKRALRKGPRETEFRDIEF